MNGTVTRIRKLGVEATMDSPLSSVAPGDLFQISRGGQVLTTVRAHRIMDTLLRLNYLDPTNPPAEMPQVGDLVAPAPPPAP